MIPFLKIVADDIYDKFNGNLADIAIVFPNKRASLFLNEYLLQKNEGRPMWSPVYITISELFEQCSNMVKGDSILLVSKLYKAYKAHTDSNESIDTFYHWGEMLIRDFDDIDKNLVDADSIFANLHALRSMGDASDTLDKEQKEAIKQFFINFKVDVESKLKERFIRIWEVIGKIYHSFRDELRHEGIAYEGMIYRDVIENDNIDTLQYRKYVFVGFNALNRVERCLFEKIKQRDLALFYWDYDSSYTDDERHEAGRFMRSNLKMFPNTIELPSTLQESKKEIEIISTTTDSVQARYASQWVEKNLTPMEVETAVILCDESKLESMLHIIPPTVQNINITMGFPISHTPVYSLVRLLTDLQTTGYDTAHGTFGMEIVHKILNHPYVLRNSSEAANTDKKIIEERLFFPPMEMLRADDFLSLIFERRSDNAIWINSIGNVISYIANNIGKEDKTNKQETDLHEELFREALLKVFTQTQRFISLIESGDLNMQQQSIGRLFMRVLSSASMPFHGEPIIGMQVMGLLETRNLDFKNILLLSANEGNLPKKSAEGSFIPYNLRRAFGLTLSEHRDSIYAYNFYRLLQRAEKVTLVYNNSTDSTNRGECSRYILQLQASHANQIDRKAIENSLHNSAHAPVAIKKSEEIIKYIRNRYDFGYNKDAQPLSPSAINRYLSCQLSFFYRYIMRLNAPDEVSSAIESRDFGNIFHNAAELFYEEITAKNNGTIEKSDLEEYIKNDAHLYKFIDKAFASTFFKITDGKMPIYDGEQFINREVLFRFLKRLVKMDAQHAPFQYIGSEEDLFFNFRIETEENEEIKLKIGGRIDRIDKKDGTIEIIDYKTGGKEEKPADLAQVFAHDGKHMGYIFQALLYSVAALENNLSEKVSPSLIYIHDKSNAKRSDFIIKIANKPLYDASPLKDDFKRLLAGKLNELFDIKKAFEPACDKERCKWCDFKNICGR